VRLCDHTPNALDTKSILRKEIRLKMAHESCKGQIAVLEMNGQSVPRRWTSMCKGSNTARRQCNAEPLEIPFCMPRVCLYHMKQSYQIWHNKRQLTA